MSSIGRTKNYYFSLADKNECAVEMKITTLYAFHKTFGPNGGMLAAALFVAKIASSHDATSPCYLLQGLVAGTSPIVCADLVSVTNNNLSYYMASSASGQDDPNRAL